MKALAMYVIVLCTAGGAIALPVPDSLISVPVSICAGILGNPLCGKPSTPGGLVNVPVHTCIGAVGLAKCSEASSSGGSPGKLINIPVGACIAALGKAQCDQQPSGNGLISVPINICLAAIGKAHCRDYNDPPVIAASGEPSAGGGTSNSSTETVGDGPIDIPDGSANCLFTGISPSDRNGEPSDVPISSSAPDVPDGDEPACDSTGPAAGELTSLPDSAHNSMPDEITSPPDATKPLSLSPASIGTSSTDTSSPSIGNEPTNAPRPAESSVCTCRY